MTAFYFSDQEIAKAVTDLSKHQLEEMLDAFRSTWRKQQNEKTNLPSKVIKTHIGVRYFEDGDVCRDGVWETDVNENQPLIPCCVFHEYESHPGLGEYTWDPIIDPATGRILNWEHGVQASVHYKVCDCCGIDYEVDGEMVISVEDYVPKFLCPDEDGYGVYVILDIDENGNIKQWNTKLFNKWVNSNFENIQDFSNLIV